MILVLNIFFNEFSSINWLATKSELKTTRLLRRFIEKILPDGKNGKKYYQKYKSYSFKYLRLK